MNKDQRTAAKARCDAATEGPWEWRRGKESDEPEMLGRVGEVGVQILWPEVFHDTPIIERESWADLEFIANARTDLPMALEALDEKDAEIERLRAALREMQGRINEATGTDGSSRDGWSCIADINDIAAAALGSEDG